MEREFDYDLFVIGGGSGGLSCSKEAASYEAKVGVADFVTPTPIGITWGLGGTCVNVGCIPKKLMHQAAILGESMEDAKHYGWKRTEEVPHDWNTMVTAIQGHIQGLNSGYEIQLEDKNVVYYNKMASLIDKHTIRLSDDKGSEEIVKAKNIVLSMGGRPIYPDIPGIKENSITSDDLFSLKYPPGKTLTIGGSYVSLECAGFLRGLGYDVTVMVRSILLRGFDQEMANKIGDYMEEVGVKFLKRYNLVKVERLSEGSPGSVRVTFRAPDGTEVAEEFNTIMVATGRKPLTENIGLENAGIIINPKNGCIITDDNDKTNIDNIYAIGDLADGRPELTPVAIQAGQLLAKRLYNYEDGKCDYTNVPTTVFTPLEYGACGYSEEDAIAKYGEYNVKVFQTNFTPLETTIPKRLLEGGYAKIVANENDDNRVLGIHVLGPNAGEIIQGFSIALKLGATKAHFDQLIGIHPTNAEIFTTMSGGC